ncbi:hypothetical protein ACHAWT_010181 [Skeletonema menzelii]
MIRPPHHFMNLRCKTPKAKSMSTSCAQRDCIFPMHILGGGSIGFLFGSKLKTCGDVTMLLRRHNKPRLKETPSDGSFTAIKYFAPVQVRRTSDREIITTTTTCDIKAEIIGDAHDPIESLLVCTKANDAIPALSSIWDRLDRKTTAKVIILSNGALAIRDSIQKHFNDHQNVQIITATTTHGAYTEQISDTGNKSGYCVVHAGDGLTYCTNNKFIDACQKVGWKGGALSDFEMNMMLWKKLAANCVINPLTAIHGVKNGQLLRLDDNIDGTITNILEELSSIAILEMEPFIQAEEDLEVQARLQRSIREHFSVKFLKDFVTTVMTDTSDNISSMLQDVNANRTTEVRFLNGYVANLGEEKYSIDCKNNKGMCNKVEDLKY